MFNNSLLVSQIIICAKMYAFKMALLLSFIGKTLFGYGKFFIPQVVDIKQYPIT